MPTRIYNSPNPGMMIPPLWLRWALCPLLFLPQLSAAADWHQPVSQLSAQIAGLIGPGVVALTVNNRSSITQSDAEQIRREMATALESSGVHVWQPDQAAAHIQLTLSENLQDYVWFAQVQQGSADTHVFLLSMPRPTMTPAGDNASAVTIRATSLISQPDPILDVTVLEGTPPRLLALGRTSITLEERQGSSWTVVQSLPITSPNALPRDARGKILVRRDHLFDAYLPGLVCQSANTTPLQMTCSASDDPWPVAPDSFGLSAFFSPTRNFFTGALVPGIAKQNSAPPFYSAAPVPRSNYVVWVFAGLDGQVHLLDGFNQQVLGRVRWGSNLAGVHAACRPGWQLLADSAETESADSIQAFEFADREPAAVSPKLALNGSVTALWPTAAADSAIAVYRNSQTGNYEALQLSLDCSR
jgi:hypothetical protein